MYTCMFRLSDVSPDKVQGSSRICVFSNVFPSFLVLYGLGGTAVCLDEKSDTAAIMAQRL